MARTQQDESRKTFVVPVVVPKPIDFSKVDMNESSLFDQALHKRLSVLEALIGKHADPADLIEAQKASAAAAAFKPVTPEDILLEKNRKLADLKRQIQELENSEKPTDPNVRNPAALGGQ